MTTLAWSFIAAWFSASVVFAAWKSTVRYPTRPLIVVLPTAAAELLALSLAIGVLT